MRKMCITPYGLAVVVEEYEKANYIVEYTNGQRDGLNQDEVKLLDDDGDFIRIRKRDFHDFCDAFYIMRNALENELSLYEGRFAILDCERNAVMKALGLPIESRDNGDQKERAKNEKQP